MPKLVLDKNQALWYYINSEGSNMRTGKAHKIEVGKSKPTDNSLTSKTTNEKVWEWLQKVNEAGKYIDGDNIKTANSRIASVLVDLINETQKGNVPREVISKIMEKRGIMQALKEAQERIKERGK